MAKIIGGGVVSLQAHIDDFISYLATVRRLSYNTTKAYRRDLQMLAVGLDTTPIANTTPAILRRLLAKYMAKGAHPSTVTRRLAAWRMFFDYLNKRGDANPARTVNAPKKPARLPKALTPDETAALFVAKGDNTVLALRDTAMFELLYSSALRVSEMVALDVADLDSSHHLVYVRQGKGGQGRVAPIGREARQALKKWLTARAVAGCSHDALFIGKSNRRLGVRSVQLRLGQLAKKSGLAGRVSPHVLRHSCASHFLQSSGNLRATQELLGHKSIAATQIYTRLDFQNLAKTYDKAHPKARRNTAAAK